MRKLANKAIKKAKAFLIQKITKKLKALDQNDPKRQKREELLAMIKKIDLEQYSRWHFRDSLEADDYVHQKIITVLDLSDDSDISSELCAMLQNASLKRSKLDLAEQMKGFLQKLYHDAPKDMKISSKNQRNNISDDSSSIFITSLDTEQKMSQRKKNRLNLYSDDESDDESVFPVHKKKNRPGQRARRELWEKQYGQNAKHIRKLKIVKSQKPLHRPKMPLEGNPASNNLESVKDLHPSWAAKLQQKQKLTAAFAENKRIVFDE
jgi:ribosomal protein S17E